MVVRPRIEMYPRRMDGVKEGRVGGGSEGAGHVGGEGSVFEVKDRGSSRVDGEGGNKGGDSRWEWWGLRG